MEKMLEDKDIKLPFCISWANEPWTRSWDGKHKDVLIDQIYGDEGDWEDHISYLLQFFKDDRYIKVDNKPIFLITKYREIKRCKEMFDYFNNRAKEHSLDGIYFVHTDRGYYKIDENINFSAKVEFEPTFTSLTTNITSLWTRRVFRYIVKIINILFNTRFLVNIPISTGNLYKRSLENKPKGNIKTIPGAFISWDNSPRRRHEASILQDFSIEDFKDYISKKILKSRDIYNSDFLFINAWNEWAEGAYLEPDKKYGFSYLEAVQSSLRKLKMR